MKKLFNRRSIIDSFSAQAVRPARGGSFGLRRGLGAFSKFFVILASVFIAGQDARAQTGTADTYNVTAGGASNWDTSANWSLGAIPTLGTTGTSGTDAYFGNTNAAETITLTSTDAALGLYISDTDATTFAGSSLKVGADGITVSAGSGAVSFLNVTVSNAQTWTNNSGSLLTIGATTAGGGGTINQRVTIVGPGTTVIGNSSTSVTGTGGFTIGTTGTSGSFQDNTSSGGVGGNSFYLVNGTLSSGAATGFKMKGLTNTWYLEGNFSVVNGFDVSSNLAALVLDTNSTLTNSGGAPTTPIRMQAVNNGASNPGAILTLTGAGYTWITGTSSTYSGGTVLGGGQTLMIDGDGSLGAVPGTSSTNITFTSSATIEAQNDSNPAAANPTLVTGGTVSLSANRTISVANGAVATFDTSAEASTTALTTQTIVINGLITGSGGIAETGAGTLILTDSNNYTGNTAVTGTLSLQAAGAISSGTLTLAATSVLNETVSNGLSGSASLSVTGGAQTISFANNYTGGTAISAGSLIVSNTAALGAAGAALNIGGGAVDLATNTSVNSYNVTVTGNGTIESDLATAGAAITQQLGTLSIGGNTLTITSGTLATSGTAVVGFGATTLNSTANATTTFAASTAGVTLGSVTGSAVTGSTDTLAFTGTNVNQQITGGISDGSGGGRVALSLSAGTLTLSGSNTYSGLTTLTSGTLILNGVNTSTGATTLTGGALVLGSGSNGGLAGGLITIGGGATIQAGGNTLVTSSNNLTFTNGQNSFFGAAQGATSGTGNLTFTNVGIATGNGTGSLAVTNSTVLTLSNGGITTNAFTKNGTGTLILNGIDYEEGGAFTINAGLVQLSGTTILNGNGGSTLAVNGGTLDINGLNTTTKALSGTGGTILNNDSGTTATLTLGIGNNQGAGTYSGIIANNNNSGSGVVALTINDLASAVVTLTGADTYTGATTLVSTGTLQIGNGVSGSISSSGTVTLSGAGFLAFDEANGSTQSNTIVDTAGTVVGFEGSGITNTLSGNISGAGGFTQSGSGVTILSGSNSFSGLTTISNGGTLQLGNGGTTGSIGSGNVTDNAALVFNRSDAALTLTGIISGTGTVTQAGPGQTTLTGVNTYTGATTVSNGALQLGIGGSLAGTAVTVGSGSNAALFVAGNYTIGTSGTASLTLAANTGTLSTVDGTINKLTIGGSNSLLTIGGNDTIDMEVSGTTSDEILLAGSGSGQKAAVSGTSTINLTQIGALLTGGTDILISAPGGITYTSGTFALGTANGIAGTLSIVDSATTVSLVDVANATPTTAYFSGTLSSVWNTISGSGSNALVNFNTDATSGISTNQLPGATTDVHFYTSNPPGTNLNTTLGQNFTINSLTVDGAATGGESGAVTIGGANTLTIMPASSGIGINIGAGAGLLTISAPLVTGSSQTWTNNSSNALAVSGGLTDAGQTVTIAGSGSGVSITTNTVTLSGSSGFTVNSGAGTLAISAPVSAAATTYWTNNSANAMTVSGTISGAGGLTTAGTGIIVLSASNTYTGLTTVSGGTLQLGTNNAIATANNLTVNTGGTFDLNGYTENLGTTATVTDNGTITSSSGTGNLIITSLGLFTGSGLVSGTMNVTYDYTSAIGHQSAINFANTGNIVVNTAGSAGDLQLTGTVNNIGTITNSGTGVATLILGFQSTAGSNIGSNVQSLIENSSSSALEIGGINDGFASGTGSVIIMNGTVSIYSTAGTQLGAGNVVFTSTGGTFDLSGQSETIAGLDNGVNGTGSGIVTSVGANATLTLGGSNAYSFGGTLQNAAAKVLTLTVNLTGTGSQILSGANTYNGATTVSSGLLQIGNGVSGSLSGSSAVTVSAAGTLALDEATGSTFSNKVTTFSGTIAGAEGGGITNTVSSFLSGTGVFIQTGAGTTVLSSATNTFSGGVAVNNGTVSVAVVAAAGSAQGLGDNKTVTLGVNGGTAGTLVYTGTSNTLGQNITALGNGTISNTGGGLLTLSGTLTKSGEVLALTSGSFNVTGRIVGTGASFNSDLDVSGSSSVLLSNANNTYFGPTVVSGSSTLQNGVANALPTSTILTFGSSTDTAGQINTYDLNGNNQSVAGLSSTGSATEFVTSSLTSSATNTLTITGTNVAETYGGVIQNGSGHVALTVSGGTEVLTGVNSYTGVTGITSGTLTVAAAGTAGNANGGTLAGTPVTVGAGGTLLVSASNALGASTNVSLNGGTYKVSGNSFEGTAASVGRGSQPDTNVQGLGNLTLTAASTLDFGVGSISTQVFGSFTDAGNALLTIADYTSSTNINEGQSGVDGTDDRLIFDVAGGLTTQQLADISFGAGTTAGQINLGGNFYEVSAVPEPTTLLAGLVLLGFLGLRERRRLNALCRWVTSKKA